MQDKVVVVMKATGGISAAITEKLCFKGAKLLLVARNSQN